MEDFNQSLNTIPASISPEALVAYSKKPQGESS
jgi:hypothetical protein